MMVDCASPRCAQDRRLLKKELLSWTKKVPILLGLERIAEVYSGKNVFQALMEPFQDLESGEARDWNPNPECHYCMAPVDSDKEDSDQEPELTGHSDIDAIDFYQHYMPMGFPAGYSLDGSTVDNCKPLDLSASSRQGDNVDSEDASQPLVELKVPQVTNKISKKKDMGGKKSYSDEDLSAAVSDIRSGKLGTRRAAALYGIPRSTLRNKIFRMESENACERTCVSNLSMADLLQNMANHEAARPSWSQDSWEQRLDLLRRKHDLNAGFERPFGMPPLFFNSRNLLDYEKDCGGPTPFNYEAKMPFLQELVRKFAEHRMEMERSECLGGSFLPNMGHRLFAGNSNQMGLASPNLSPGGMVDLKIPSYKPMRSYGNNSANNGMAADLEKDLLNGSDTNSVNSSHSKINDTLKNIITKTITEKVKIRGQLLEGDIPSTMMNDYLKRELDSPSKTSAIQVKRFKCEQRNSEDFLNKGESDSEQPQKKTRPKRGQYRKYNSQLLLEAVRAVQRGEMSVHRAGSYFGVPHSTLEYKVKERHLMRQKKPREPRSKKSSSPTTASTDLNIPSRVGNSEKYEDSDEAGNDRKTHDESPSPNTSANETSSQDSSCLDSLPATPIQDTMRSNPDMIAHSINYLLTAQAAGLPIPGGHPFSNFYMPGGLPMGFGWPPTPLMNGGLPLGMPDPALAACFPGYNQAMPGMNLSASDLLKKLQRKVQQNSGDFKHNSFGRTQGNANQPLQGSKSESSQLIVK